MSEKKALIVIDLQDDFEVEIIYECSCSRL
jgi:hypothetical protein